MFALWTCASLEVQFRPTLHSYWVVSYLDLRKSNPQVLLALSAQPLQAASASSQPRRQTETRRTKTLQASLTKLTLFRRFLATSKHRFRNRLSAFMSWLNHRIFVDFDLHWVSNLPRRLFGWFSYIDGVCWLLGNHRQGLVGAGLIVDV